VLTISFDPDVVPVVRLATGLKHHDNARRRPSEFAINRDSSSMLASLQGHRGWTNMTRVILSGANPIADGTADLSMGFPSGPGVASYFARANTPVPTMIAQDAVKICKF